MTIGHLSSEWVVEEGSREIEISYLQAIQAAARGSVSQVCLQDKSSICCVGCSGIRLIVGITGLSAAIYGEPSCNEAV